MARNPSPAEVEGERLSRLTTFARWLSDGTTVIGIFQNQDLGHRDLGRKIAVPYDSAKRAEMVVGRLHAPDHGSIGLGWRYLLTEICESVDSAERAMTE